MKTTMTTIMTFIFALVFAVGVMGQSNTATTSSTGNSNYVAVDQIGDQNESTTTQVGNRNAAETTQGGFGGGSVQSNFAESVIDQLGNDNYAAVSQRQGFSGGSAVSVHTIDQDGNGNSGKLTTFNGGNTGDIVQLGNQNYGFGVQAAGGNSIIITQIGNRNGGEVRQASGGGDNEGKIEQHGNRNFGEIVQTGTADNKASQWVAGNDNTVLQTQESDDNRQRVELTGNGNTFTTLQTVGSGNVLYINSRGTGPGENTVGSDNSYFNATQEGSDNIISGEMGGSNNTLMLSQVGDQNKVGTGMWEVDGFRIEGNGNYGEINQSGFGNTATMTVLGNNNTAVINQSAGL